MFEDIKKILWQSLCQSFYKAIAAIMLILAIGFLTGC